MTETTLSEPEHSATEQPQINERAILIVVALASALAPLNSTMIAVALPGIMTELAVPVTSAGWLVTGYLLAMASLQPVAGKLGDRFGRRSLILGGLVYFCIVSLGAAFSPSFPLLLFFRLQQGIAGAVVFPNGSALLREIVPAERRAGQFGLVGAAIGTAAAGGPLLGGVLAGALGWQAIFYVNLLIVLPALWLGWRVMPAAVTTQKNGRFDITGAVLLSVTLIGLAWLLTQVRAGETRLLAPGILIAVVLVIVLVAFELRSADPVFQPRLFRHRSFAAASGAILSSNMAMYTTLLAVPMALTRLGSWNEMQIGLLLLSLSAAMVLFTPIGGRMSDRYGRRWPTVAGLALLAVGFASLALDTGGTLGAKLFIGLGVAGAGLGTAMPGMQTAALESVEPQEAGAASGVYMTARYLGSITGSSLLAALIASTGSELSDFNPIYWMVVAAAAVAVVFGLRLEHTPSHAPATD